MGVSNKNQIIVGLGFGDEGKGSIVDYLCATRHVDNVVRFSGGGQAAHNVVLNDGREHTFAMFGSGTFRGAKTILTKHVLVSLFNMVPEADHLQLLTGIDPFSLMYISENALVTTPYHVEANHQRELERGTAAHGSCGLGIGETTSWHLNTGLGVTMSDLTPSKKPLLHAKLTAHKQAIEDEFRITVSTQVDDIINSYHALLKDKPLTIITDSEVSRMLREGVNVFEGSQGALLDEWYGFHPHTTWSTVTAENAQSLLREAELPAGEVIGVTRSYTTRHGHGPMPSEQHERSFISSYPEKHNEYGTWQGAWRVGYLDLPLLHYAVKANNGVDKIALTHADLPVTDVVSDYPAATALNVSLSHNLDSQQTMTEALTNPGRLTLEKVTLSTLVCRITEICDAPVVILSSGPTAEDKVRL